MMSFLLIGKYCCKTIERKISANVLKSHLEMRCMELQNKKMRTDFRLNVSSSYLSALSAVSVNTDTPTEVSWMTGMSLHAASPNTHSSEK